MNRRILIIPLLLLLLFLTACSQQTNLVPRFSFIEVVENQEDAILHTIPDIEIILEDSEIVVGREEAMEKYPRYELRDVPAYIIFENTGALTKDMVMWTYDQTEAIEYLEDWIAEFKEAMEEQ